MGDSARALLQAAQLVLKSDSDLVDLVATRIYGAPPANPSYPYVLITCSSQPFSADDFEGMEHTLRVQGFVRDRKPGPALAIRECVFAALNRQEVNLGLADHELVMIEHEGVTDCFPEEDGRTYQSIIEFKVLVQ